MQLLYDTIEHVHDMTSRNAPEGRRKTLNKPEKKCL